MENKCYCEEISCKINCDKNHTYHTYSCDKCKTIASTPPNEILKAETPESEKLSTIAVCANCRHHPLSKDYCDCFCHCNRERFAETKSWEEEFRKLLNEGCNDDFYVAYVEDLLKQELEKVQQECSDGCDKFVEWSRKREREKVIEWLLKQDWECYEQERIREDIIKYLKSND